jgi:hypothetical protein
MEQTTRFVLQEENNLCAKTSCCYCESVLCHPCVGENSLPVLQSIAYEQGYLDTITATPKQCEVIT